MLTQFLTDAQISLYERPITVMSNALLGGAYGLLFTLLVSDVVTLLNSSQIEEFIKEQADQFDCTVEDNFNLFLSEISCKSAISKKALFLAAKIYQQSSLYPLPLNTWSIARNVCVGTLLGFAAGVDHVKKQGLINNPNGLFNHSSKLYTTASHALESAQLEL